MRREGLAGLVIEFCVIDRCAVSCCATDAASLGGWVIAVPLSPSLGEGRKGNFHVGGGLAGGEGSGTTHRAGGSAG